jgi:hypothetical protein
MADFCRSDRLVYKAWEFPGAEDFCTRPSRLASTPEHAPSAAEPTSNDGILDQSHWDVPNRGRHPPALNRA